MNLFKIFFPKQCFICKKTGQYLCSQCTQQINFHPQQRCSICNKNSITGATHPRCRSPWGINGIWAMAKYQPPLKTIINKFKYGYASDLGNSLVSLLAQNLPSNFETYDLIIPLPLHPSRQRWRGFNQTIKIAEKLSRQLGVNFSNKILIRSQQGIPQAQIKDRNHRLQNLKQAFKLSSQIDPSRLKNKSILLIDDITTTGTTLRQAALPLKRAGAKQVWGIVLAR